LAPGPEACPGRVHLVGVNPTQEQFTDLARQLRQEADEQARRLGRELGAAVTSAMAA
jgi:hypothetical protein